MNGNVDSEEFGRLPFRSRRHGKLGTCTLMVHCAWETLPLYLALLTVDSGQWASLPFPTQPGQVGGHEGVGEVVKLGLGSDTSTIKVGDRVG